MKVIKLVLFCIPVFFYACGFNSVQGKGDVQKFERKVSDFTKLSMDISGKVFIIQGSEYSCTIETEENIAGLLTTDVKDHELKISQTKNFNTNTLNVYITMPFVEKLSLNGSGDINCKNEISSKNLELELDGSGNINMNKIIVMTLSCSIDGSGNINLVTGKTKDANFELGGSGNITADHIDCENVVASIDGSGNIDCFASQNLKVDIDGSGNLKYKGQPKTKIDISGSGQVNSF